ADAFQILGLAGEAVFRAEQPDELEIGSGCEQGRGSGGWVGGDRGRLGDQPGPLAPQRREPVRPQSVQPREYRRHLGSPRDVTSLPSASVQTRTVPSAPADTSCLPSGSRARPVTPCAWPSNGRTGSGLSVSNR